MRCLIKEKKLSLLMILACLGILLTACQNKPHETSQWHSKSLPYPSKQSEASMTYQDYTSLLIPMTYQELNQKMAENDSFLIFLGRETCSYCQEFVPKLYAALNHHPITVYYYDTENRSDLELQQFRMTYQISTVPHLAYFQGNQQVTQLENPSQVTQEKLISFLRSVSGGH